MFLKLRLNICFEVMMRLLKLQVRELIDPTTGQPTDETTVAVAGEEHLRPIHYRNVACFTPEKKTFCQTQLV